MMEARLIFMALVCLCIAQLAFAEPNYAFKNTGDQRRFETLIKETRCVICQNQTLFDSSSAIAGDMRNQIHAMISSGLSNREIRNYLRARYGDSILFMPPWRASTMILWLGPSVMLGFGLAAYRRFMRRKGMGLLAYS